MTRVDHRSLFDHYSNVHVNWEWEFLTRALQPLIPLLKHVGQYFDVPTMLGSSKDTGDIGILTAVGAVLAAEPHFAEVCELAYVLGSVVTKYAKKLETCWCHEPIWKSRSSWKRKKSRLKAESGHSKCVWKGKTAPWWVAEGLEALFEELATCSSERLDTWLSELPEHKRSKLLRRLKQARHRLIEVLRQKFLFWKHIPYKALGAFWGECGGNESVSRRLLKECLVEFDQAVAAGRSLHRVARRLFGHGTVCRREFELWLESANSLSFYSTAYQYLLEYALCSPVERTIEAIHAMIKRIGSCSPNSLPPYIVSELRESYNLQLLRSNVHFDAMVKKLWWSNHLLSDLLSLRCEDSAVQQMTRLGKIKTVYQCTLACEDEDTSLDIARRPVGIAILDRPLKATTPPTAFGMCICHLKALFNGSAVYSMPSSFFELAVSGSFDYLENPDPIHDTLVAAAVDLPKELDFASVASHAFFVVTNATPENRRNVNLPHLEETRTLLHVSKCELLKQRGDTLIMHQGGRQHIVLDARSLASRMHQSLCSILEWKVTQDRWARQERSLKALAIEDVTESYSMHENVVTGFSSASANVDAIVPAGTHQLPDPADHVLALTLFQQQYDSNGRVPVLLQDT